jgi:hypothetical protein
MICHVINAIIYVSYCLIAVWSHMLVMTSRHCTRCLSCLIGTCRVIAWNALRQDVGVTDGHGSLAGSRRVVLPLVVSLSLLSTRPIRMSYHLVSMSWQSSGLQQGVGRLDVVRRSLAGRRRIVSR